MSKNLSRRDFFSGTIGTGAALSCSSLIPSREDLEPSHEALTDEAIIIHVPSPAGPPPLGAPVETSVPFARGQLLDPRKLAIYSPEGKPTPAQFRPALKWPDGSIRWLAVAFEGASGPGDYVLREGETLSEPDMV